MFTTMPIRKKILCGTLMLAGTLLLLMGCSLRGVYAFRGLASIITARANELPISDELAKAVDDLRESYQPMNFARSKDPLSVSLDRSIRGVCHPRLSRVQGCISEYRAQLQMHIDEDPLLADRSAEKKLLAEIQSKFNQIAAAIDNEDVLVNRRAPLIEEDLNELSQKVNELPTYLHKRLADVRDQVRSHYRTWYGFTWLSALGAFIILGVAFVFFRRSVVQPFKELLAGSRLIAKGNFDHRIHIESRDELSELAEALNAMTSRFVEIRDHLNEKVKQGTREVVRSEQLASVGFLAAGVAHEINNPLASIAWSAEALESHLHELLHSDLPENASATATDDNKAKASQSLDVLRKYLKRIQDEAFRCKGITERLLDFSRLGESQKRSPADIDELITDVIGLIEHLAPYRNKTIEFKGRPGLTAWVSAPEFKQVILNLLTNALDSTDENGVVKLALEHDDLALQLTIEDNGCGMTEEVLKHLYEPFFTRRRDGKGTGLGLSITYRIVQDHGARLLLPAMDQATVASSY